MLLMLFNLFLLQSDTVFSNHLTERRDRRSSGTGCMSTWRQMDPILVWVIKGWRIGRGGSRDKGTSDSKRGLAVLWDPVVEAGHLDAGLGGVGTVAVAPRVRCAILDAGRCNKPGKAKMTLSLSKAYQAKCL